MTDTRQEDGVDSVAHKGDKLRVSSARGLVLRSFQTAGGTAAMRYLEFGGAGTPLLMIHGLGCASSMDYPPVATAPALVGRHSILIDLLGFGSSDRPETEGYGVGDHAVRIAAFVRSMGWHQVDLYGHSMGGSIAIEAADILGATVHNLILSEANLDAGGGEFSRPIAAGSEDDYVASGHARMIKRAEADGDTAWASTMRAASAHAVYRGATSLVAGSTPDWRSRFLRHPARKAYVFGEYTLPDPDQAFLSSHGIPVTVVAKAGHGMSVDNPQGLARVIACALAA